MLDYVINNVDKNQMIYIIVCIFSFISVIVAISKIKDSHFLEVSNEMDAVFDEMINDFDTLLSPNGFTSEVDWYINQYKLTYGSEKLDRIYSSEQHFDLIEYMYKKYKIKHAQHLHFTNSINVATSI
jgi:hypothetical protein